MKDTLSIGAIFLCLALCSGCGKDEQEASLSTQRESPPKLSKDLGVSEKMITLPTPAYSSRVSVEEAIAKRMSTRRFSDQPLAMKDVSQLLWAAAGKHTVDSCTGATRTCPSASGIYPLEVYLVAGNVTGLDAGVYIYGWQSHAIKLVKNGDIRMQLAVALRNPATKRNMMIDGSPACLVFTIHGEPVGDENANTTDLRRIEVGHAAQNLHLQAEALGMGTVVLGNFNPQATAEIKKVLGLKEEIPVYIMPVGKKQRDT